MNALEARERSFETKQVPQPVLDARSPVVDDRFRIDPTSDQNPVTVSSGREVELPQIGIGLGIGLALAFGLFLLMRYTRGRQLAH